MYLINNYVTRLKDNALYQAREEFDIPDTANFVVLKDEEIVLLYGENNQNKPRKTYRRDSENERLFEFITNNITKNTGWYRLPVDELFHIFGKSKRLINPIK